MNSWYTLTLKNEVEWEKLVNGCETPDIHFTPQYMKLFEDRTNDEATLFVTESNSHQNYVLYPFFKRKINTIPLFSDFDDIYDVISPWYFGGPILQNSKNSEKLIEQFLKEFNEYAIRESIVTEFTRIHPLLKHSQIFAKLVDAEYSYDVTYVDLIQSRDEILKNFKKSNRNAITSSERQGVQIEFSTSENAINEFYFIYSKFLKQIKTSSFYDFPIDFFKKIRTTFMDNFVVALARYDQKVVAGSIFLFKSGIVHYWLSATDEKFRSMYPTNLLLSKAIFWFKERGEKKFFLMGGSNEMLRRFKESFSPTKKQFFILKKIFNEDTYSQLNKIRNEKNPTLNSNFFPYYR